MKDVPDYRPEQYPQNRSHPQRAHSGPMNEPMHHIPNNHPPPPQQQRPPMSLMQHQNSFGDYGSRPNNNNNNNNSSYFQSPNHQQSNLMRPPNGPSTHSYTDYRTSSVLPNNNTPSPRYSSLLNSPNPIVPQARTFDEFNLGSLAHNPSNSHGRLNGPTFRNDEGHYGNFGQQSPMEHNSHSSWRGTSRDGNNTRGRGSFQPNKQASATFSYSSHNKNNAPPVRGRGAGQNTRNFGSGR